MEHRTRGLLVLLLVMAMPSCCASRGRVCESPDHSIVTGSDDPSRAALRPPRKLTRMGIFEFLRIPAGEFQVGSPDDEEARTEYEPRSTRVIPRAFYLLTTEVTNEQYMRFDPKHSSGMARDWFDNAFDVSGPSYPVIKVSVADALAFCAWLSAQDPEFAYRLPSEVEWEYACRAGTDTPFAQGHALTLADANWDGMGLYGDTEESGPGPGHPLPVGSYKPNRWGLHDMSGNVYELCTRVPLGEHWPGDPATFVGRGGSWRHPAWQARCANRWFIEDGVENEWDWLGFRIVAERRAVNARSEPSRLLRGLSQDTLLTPMQLDARRRVHEKAARLGVAWVRAELDRRTTVAEAAETGHLMHWLFVNAGADADRIVPLTTAFAMGAPDTYELLFLATASETAALREQGRPILEDLLGEDARSDLRDTDDPSALVRIVRGARSEIERALRTRAEARERLTPPGR